MSTRKCVRCGNAYAVVPDSASRSYAPFCSKRCADVDLVHWLKGEYAVDDEGKLALVPDEALPDTEQTPTGQSQGEKD